MKGRSLVRLYQTSRWGRDAIEELQIAQLERYVIAKCQEFELLQMLHLDKVSMNSLNFIIMAEKYQLDRLGNYHGPGDKRLMRILELVQKVQDNWDILHQ